MAHAHFIWRTHKHVIIDIICRQKRTFIAIPQNCNTLSPFNRQIIYYSKVTIHYYCLFNIVLSYNSMHYYF